MANRKSNLKVAPSLDENGHPVSPPDISEGRAIIAGGDVAANYYRQLRTLRLTDYDEIHVRSVLGLLRNATWDGNSDLIRESIREFEYLCRGRTDWIELIGFLLDATERLGRVPEYANVLGLLDECIERASDADRILANQVVVSLQLYQALYSDRNGSLIQGCIKRLATLLSHGNIIRPHFLVPLIRDSLPFLQSARYITPVVRSIRSFFEQPERSPSDSLDIIDVIELEVSARFTGKHDPNDK